MRYFAYGFILGGLLALILVLPAQSAERPAPEEKWSSATVQPGEPSAADEVAPPRGSFGFKGCGQYAIWVFLADGKSYRFDSEHSPKTPADMSKLLDWLYSGPNDIYEPKSCAPLT